MREGDKRRRPEIDGSNAERETQVHHVTRDQNETPALTLHAVPGLLVVCRRLALAWCAGSSRGGVRRSCQTSSKPDGRTNQAATGVCHLGMECGSIKLCERIRMPVSAIMLHVGLSNNTRSPTPSAASRPRGRGPPRCACELSKAGRQPITSPLLYPIESSNAISLSTSTYRHRVKQATHVSQRHHQRTQRDTTAYTRKR